MEIDNTQLYSSGLVQPQPKKKIDKKNLTIFIIAFAIPVILGLIGYYVYSVKARNPIDLKSPLSRSQNDGSQKADVMNPLTGVLYTPFAAQEWLDNRPLAVMVNNHVDARPQSGLIYTDVVYEIVAEGGITRFIAFFLTNTPEKIGPVRSARHYFFIPVKELGDAMIMHIGWSPQAIEAIDTWPVRSLFKGGADFWRDNPRNVATEHTAFVNGKYLREVGNELGWEGKREITPWKFKDETIPPVANEIGLVGEFEPIQVNFWYEGDYTAIWKYNRDTNSYLRFSGFDLEGNPIPLFDQEQTTTQVSAKNLIVLYVTELSIDGDDKNRLDYELVGSGQGVVFIDGTSIPVTWSKASRDDRTMLYDESGNEVVFNRGNFWIMVVPDRNIDQVIY